MPNESRAKRETPEWSWPTTSLSDPNLIATVQFCLIVLLVMLIAMFSFPALGAIVEQYNQF